LTRISRAIPDAQTDLAAASGVVARTVARTADDTRTAGRALGEHLHAADLVILSGELGAGKTTYTQGLADALAVRGPITSPTFVIARVHPPLDGGVPLVHVDAYRLGSLAELDDLDLDASIDESVTVVEWGEGKAEVLSQDRLDVRIERATADDATAQDPRLITVTAHGPALLARFSAAGHHV
jgi:tRNA threonylcarbamoyladenosine biosynthesis protein TsaE